MYKYILNLAIFFFFISCFDNDDIVKSDPKLESFSVQAYGGEVQCTINNEEATIAIPNVKKGSDITDVNYTLSENSTIYPTPESVISSWDKEEVFVVTSPEGKTKKYIAVLIDYDDSTLPEEDVDARIYTTSLYGRITKNFFYDIKDGSSVTEEKAVKFYQQEGMNGIRIPIYGNYKDKETKQIILGHIGPGEVVEADYEKVVSSVKRAKLYNPNLMVFASKKLNGDASFASWLKDGDVLNSERYAGMIIDFLKFMKQNEIEIDVLGIDNEYDFNEGNITAAKYIEIVELLQNKITAEGLKMPRFIGPERYNPQGFKSGNWLYNLFEKDLDLSTIDIYGTHYYPKHHFYSMNQKLKTEFDAISKKGMEFWATEPHWDNEELAKADLLGHARMAICALWDQTDLGMDAFMWWGYPLDDTDVRGSLMHDISIAIYGSQPIRMIDHDGEELLGNKDYTGKWTDGRQKPNNDPVFDERLHTRAFIRNGNEVNVYIINVRYNVDVVAGKGIFYEDYAIKIENGVIDGDVEYKQWTDNSSPSGDSGKFSPASDSIISLDIPLRSITRLTFKIKTNV